MLSYSYQQAESSLRQSYLVAKKIQSHRIIFSDWLLGQANLFYYTAARLSSYGIFGNYVSLLKQIIKVIDKENASGLINTVNNFINFYQNHQINHKYQKENHNKKIKPEKKNIA